jgi:hypothetical protein
LAKEPCSHCNLRREPKYRYWGWTLYVCEKWVVVKCMGLIVCVSMVFVYALWIVNSIDVLRVEVEKPQRKCRCE